MFLIQAFPSSETLSTPGGSEEGLGLIAIKVQAGDLTD